jgi:flagellar protein FlaG
MNIAPVSAGVLPVVAHGVSGSQPEAQLAIKQQVSAPAPQAEVGKTEVDHGEADPAELKQRVDELNAAMKQHGSSVQFSIDDDSGRTIVKVVDTDTDTVLRQYPSREMLAISKQIDKFQGMFVKTQA